MTGYKSGVCAISCILASTSSSLLTMEKSHQDGEKCPENVKRTIEIHEKVGGSVDHNSDPENDTKDPSLRHGIDEKHEKRILRKLDIHLLPFVSLLYLLSFM